MQHRILQHEYRSSILFRRGLVRLAIRKYVKSCYGGSRIKDDPAKRSVAKG